MKLYHIIFTAKCENVSLIKAYIDEESIESWKTIQFGDGNVNVEYKVNLRQIAKGAFIHDVMLIKKRDNGISDLYTLTGLVYEDIPTKNYEVVDVAEEMMRQAQQATKVTPNNINPDPNVSVRGLPPPPGTGGCGGCGSK